MTFQDATGSHRVHCLGSLLRACTGFLLRPLRLPDALYGAVPWVYLGTGTAALAGGLYLPEESWYLPYLALAGLGMLRLAVGVAALRRRSRAEAPHPART